MASNTRELGILNWKEQRLKTSQFNIWLNHIPTGLIVGGMAIKSKQSIRWNVVI